MTETILMVIAAELGAVLIVGLLIWRDLRTIAQPWKIEMADREVLSPNSAE